MMKRAVGRLISHDLRKAFDRICWTGEPLRLDPARPAVLYANHHSFFDGYLLWMLCSVHLHRETMVWMRDWDRFPFFSFAGALPFPADDVMRRARTISRTRRIFAHRPSSTLILFPEGEMHPREEGVLSFSDGRMQRLSRLLPEVQWCPIAIYATWRNGNRPEVFMGAGPILKTVDGGEEARLRSVLDSMPSRSLDQCETLMQGRMSVNRRWNFRALSHLIDS